MNASTLGVATTVTPIRYPEVELAFAWDYGLIAVSYLVAVAAAYSTVTLLQLRLHPAMVVLAAFNLSVSGIWSMHFIGMEALHLGVPMTFDPALTSLSAVFALLCTAAGFALVHWRVATARHGQQRVIDVSVAAHIRALKNAPHGTLLASGLLIAAGVCVMHYTGMVAMRTAASEEDGGRVEALAGVIAASVVIAVAAATAALYLAFVLPVSRRFVLPTALVAGVAVCGMHYTGIYGFRYFVRADVLARVGTMSRDAPWTPYVVCGSLLTSLATLAYTAYSYQTIINEAVERFALYVPPQVVDCVFAAATADDQQDRCDASASDPGEFGRSIAGTMTPPSLSTTNDGVARVVPERYRAAAALQHASVDIVRATQAMNSQSLDKTVGSGVRRPSTLREDAELAETLGTALEPLWFTPRDRSFDPFHLPTDDALTSAYRAINWLDLKMRPAVGTVAFIDVVDFTTHAERMSERELMREMTAFNGRCTDAIDRSGGVVDKYLGDAIMAVWNTVRPIGDHAARAVAAVHACVSSGPDDKASRSRRPSVFAPGGVGVQIGIEADPEAMDSARRAKEPLVFEARGGVQTGPLLMGNVGAAAKRNFTVLGDTVNQAARIEGLTRHYGVRCMIGQGTREALGPAACGFVTRFLDEAVLKGKEKTVLLHEVMADAAGPQVDEAAVRRAELVAAAYEALHERFRAGDFSTVVDSTPAGPSDPQHGHHVAHPLMDTPRDHVHEDLGEDLQSAAEDASEEGAVLPGAATTDFGHTGTAHESRRSPAAPPRSMQPESVSPYGPTANGDGRLVLRRVIAALEAGAGEHGRLPRTVPDLLRFDRPTELLRGRALARIELIAGLSMSKAAGGPLDAPPGAGFPTAAPSTATTSGAASQLPTPSTKRSALPSPIVRFSTK